MVHSPSSSVAALRTLIVSAAALLALLWLSAPHHPLENAEGFLTLHSFLEAVSVILAAMVFGVTWNSDGGERRVNLALLGYGLLAAALVDVGHALSFAGMPEFITPSGEDKSIRFWLAARFAAAAALLAAAMPAWAALRHTRTRHAMLAATGAFVALVYWLILGHPQALPRMFVAGSGLTAAKVGAELVITAMFAAAAWALYARARRTGARSDALLSAAAALSALGEACLSLYETTSDVFMLAGHGYKVAAFGFLYRAVYLECVRAPYDEARDQARALSESEERFRALTELSSDFYWEQDENFRFVERIGAAWEQRTYGASHTLGKQRWDLPALNLAPADWDRHRADLEAHREFRNLEIERPLGDGRTRWISTSGRPIFDAEGVFRGYRGIGEDITARKRAEQALRRSEAQLRLIADSVPAMLAYLDPNSRYLYVNRNYADFFGIAPAEFIGKTIEERLGGEVWNHVGPYFAEALAGRTTTFEGRYPRADGSLRDVSIEMVLQRDAGGTMSGVFAMVIDETDRRRAERALREREAQLSLVVDNVPAMLCYFDVGYRYRYANRQYVDFYAAGQPLEGRTLQEGLGETVWAQARDGIDRALAGETVNYTRADRREGVADRIVEVTMIPHRDAGGRIAGVHTMILDISGRLRAEQDLRLRNRAIESSVNSIMITRMDPGGQRIVYVNPAFERMTGYAEGEVLGRSPRFLYGEDRQQQGIEALRSALREEREALVLVRNYRKDGGQFWNELRLAPVRDDAGRVTHYISVANDVTDRIRYEREIERNANYDALTGLPNRNLLGDRLMQAVTQAARSEDSLAVLFVDVDHLKRINDSLGHGMGDRVIAAVGQRIAESLRTEDTVARHGGDEFVILLPHLARAEDVQRVVSKMFARIAAPMKIDAHEFVLSASAGIAMHPRDGADAETLLRNADAALYRAKEDGRNCFRYFAPEMNDRVVTFLATERNLRAAIEAREFWLQYQPIIDLASGATVGAEALIRWRRADGTMVPPADFIPVAEESGLIVPIGQWVVEAAAGQAAAWNRGRATPLYVSVNLSARQFRDPGLLDTIRGALRLADVAPELLRFEITESTVMQEPERATVLLRALKDLGVKLSVDDFGTGYSSLAYLKRFPIDVLKIDRSFVRDLPGDAEDLALCCAIINLAHALGMEVVAEGIESAEQAQTLASNGCRFAQGYHFGRPVDPAQFRSA